MTDLISPDLIGSLNEQARAAHEDDLGALGRQLARRGIDVEAVITRAMAWSVAIPTWGVGTGGTRFARFPGLGEPRGIHDKLADCGVIQQLTRGTRTVSPHIPWDKVDDFAKLRSHAESLGVALGTINSNTFQDEDYKLGSLAHNDAKVRNKAIDHHFECIDVMGETHSRDLKIWLADGSNYPGQDDLRRRQDNLHDSLQKIYARLGKD